MDITPKQKRSKRAPFLWWLVLGGGATALAGYMGAGLADMFGLPNIVATGLFRRTRS
jgi:hypothetical protein